MKPARSVKNKLHVRFYGLLIWVVTLTCSSLITKANVKPNGLFTNHMVLQQGVTVPVWGNADEGEQITITFNGQRTSTTTRNGRWMLKLSKLKPGGPFVMTIAGKDTVTISDILVGEVWLCSGQSNMERKLGLHPVQKPILNWQAEQQEASQYPQIRQYEVPKKYEQTPLESTDGKWEVCSPETVLNFSAVGYFFAKDLYQNIHVPVGIIYSAVGGTNADKWTSRAVMENDTALLSIVKKYDEAVQTYPQHLEAYHHNEQASREKYKADSITARLSGKPGPKKAVPPEDVSKTYVGGLYNAMISPLIPYAIKGVCWYQGEANNGNAKQYQKLLPALIKSWRADWHTGDFPFLIVQIAPYMDINPELREAQLLTTQQVNKTALIVTTDCGDSANIHPPNKQPVGYRLSLAARALAYNQRGLEYSGPLYKKSKIKNDHILISFSHTGSGLTAKDGPLHGFMIAGADKIFVPATAVITGNKIDVSADQVKAPEYVRFGWKKVPDVNLYNLEGLPASPFRTDGTEHDGTN